jgi:hypothetical protein
MHLHQPPFPSQHQMSSKSEPAYGKITAELKFAVAPEPKIDSPFILTGQ